MYWFESILSRLYKVHVISLNIQKNERKKFLKNSKNWKRKKINWKWHSKSTIHSGKKKKKNMLKRNLKKKIWTEKMPWVWPRHESKHIQRRTHRADGCFCHWAWNSLTLTSLACGPYLMDDCCHHWTLARLLEGKLFLTSLRGLLKVGWW